MKEGWAYKKLGEVANVTDYVANGSFATLRENVHYLDTGGYAILVRLADYTNNFDSSRFVYIDEHAYNFLSKSKLYGGEIIMSNVGSIGKSFICPKLSMPMSLAPNTIVINTSNNRFYFYYFKSPSFQSSLKTISSKTALPKFNKTQFKCLTAPVPPIAEQERIVAELDLLSSIIEKKKEQLKAYDQLAQSIFYTMFGDPIDNPKGWETKKIEDICISIVRGPFGSALKKEFFVEPNETTYKIYEQKHAIQKNATIGSYYVSEEKFNELSRFELRPNDIIMSCSGTIGELYRLPCNAEKGLMNQALLKFTLNDSVCYEYFLYMMEYMKQYFTVRGSGLQNIGSVKIIKSMLFGLPPLSLQQEFAEKIEAIERQKALVQQSIEETQTMFDYTMDKYFG